MVECISRKLVELAHLANVVSDCARCFLKALKARPSAASQFATSATSHHLSAFAIFVGSRVAAVHS